MSLVIFQSNSASECSVSPVNFFISIFIERSWLIVPRPHDLTISFYAPSFPWVLVCALSGMSECLCIGASNFRCSTGIWASDWVLEATRNNFLFAWATSRVLIHSTERCISSLWIIEVLFLRRLFKDVLETWLFPSRRYYLHLRNFQIQVQLFDVVHMYTLSVLRTIASNSPWWFWFFVKSSLVCEAFTMDGFSRVPFCDVFRLVVENLPILPCSLIAWRMVPEVCLLLGENRLSIVA